MKKTIDEFYYDINELLKKDHVYLSYEFERRIYKNSPKEVFLWLNEELERKTISRELDELITDFFYSIH